MKKILSTALLFTFSLYPINIEELLCAINNKHDEVHVKQPGLRRLEPNHEKRVREVVQLCVPHLDIEIYALPKHLSGGTQAKYKTLFVNEQDFTIFDAYPGSLPAVIGHECAHLFLLHALKRTYSGIPLLPFSIYAAHTGTNKIFTMLPKWLNNRFSTFTLKLGLIMGIGKLYSNFICPQLIYQPQEYEADQRMLNTLTLHYSHDFLVDGLAHYLALKGGLGPSYTLYDKLTKSHPHSRQRLRALKMSKQLSLQSFNTLKTLVQKRALAIVQWYLYKDQEVRKALLDKLNEDWYALTHAARLISVHSDIAEECRNFLIQHNLQQQITDLRAFCENDIPIAGYDPDELSELKEVYKHSRSSDTTWDVSSVNEQMTFLDALLQG